MKKTILYIISIMMLSFVMTGCVQDREPQIEQFNTGMNKTAEWEEYNKYAMKNKQPVLDFAATTLKYKFNKGKVYNYDHFNKDDIEVVIQTKWHNCNPADLYEFKFYMPDGRLYSYEYHVPKETNTKWTIGRKMNIKDMPAAQLDGLWNVKTYVNGKYVFTKEFTIGTNKQYATAKPNKTIGFTPFIDNEMAKWKHGIFLPQYLGFTTVFNTDYNVIPIHMIFRNLENVNVDYELFESFINEELAKPNNVLTKVIDEFKLDYIVTGTSSSLWGNSSLNNVMKCFIIDVKNKQIIDTIETKVSLSQTDFNIATNRNVQGYHPHRLKIYNQVSEDLMPILNALK